MAPPSSRRPGFSRRAQYGLFAGYVVAVIGIVLGLLFALTARFDPEGHAGIQSFFADLTSPISIAGRNGVELVGSGMDGVSAYIDAGSKNNEMETELRRAHAKLIEAQAMARENVRLKQLLKLVERDRTTIVTARLIASTGASSRRYATLSAGTSQGVANGEPVRTSEGLVGRIVAVGRITSRVLLITDGGNVVPVRRLSDGLPALATGRGDGGLDIRALEAATNPFKPGDIFVTSGTGGIYPPDIPVALAAIRTRELVVARPLADPRRLDFAAVEPAFVSPAPDLPSVPTGNP
ncbi:rod shape-determining protein MreC [Sphingomonas paeninsulae]|jgi:rod shape-determining protein MreC|uniref:Rod shape-determining protein MreC n=1 Tax=Sphingomonas paeninsulae TaxID=2319844 RepID=A0A494TQK4_SPHPE|nr:rod shape-determining protein MreC [Sphingomonas paeninsulae]AYJ87748.1 rod shape-determining protein MreC [Sphingomonas paeninsulae]